MLQFLCLYLVQYTSAIDYYSQWPMPVLYVWRTFNNITLLHRLSCLSFDLMVSFAISDDQDLPAWVRVPV